MKDLSSAYIAAEQAEEQRPLEIFHFWTNGGLHWRITSHDQAVTYLGQTFNPAAINRGPVQWDGEMEVSTMSVSAAFNEAPIDDFIAQNPIEPVWVQVIRLHEKLPNQGAVVFVGQLKKAGVKGNETSVECVGFEHALTQGVPILRYSPQCNHHIYQPIEDGLGCGVDRENYKVTATVTGSGLEWQSAAFSGYSDGWFKYGWLEYGSARRMVVYHKGSTIKIRYMILNMPSGAEVSVYAGCDRAVTTCRDKFNNVAQFGGHPHVPVDNPATKY
jgi:uncharacterized phage protein (TIGR02218 family)